MSREVSRWTFRGGSRPEGCIVYDPHPSSSGGMKMQVHHDSAPSRGQVNAFDLVRLHIYGHLDKDVDPTTPITERPSYRAMCEEAMRQPEVQAMLASEEFDEILTEEEKEGSPDQPFVLWSQSPTELFANPSKPRWLIRDILERAVIAILAGARGSYKSFLALMWAVEIAISGEWVYVISAEGNDFDRRLNAYLRKFHPGYDASKLKLRVAQRRADLTDIEQVKHLRAECEVLKIRPRLWVFDTYSKLSGKLDENSNTDVKAWIGTLDRAFKRPEPEAFDATVLIVAHVGHGDNSRARGASAFAADTDAEYIVKRDERTGHIEVSRERFKASPELPALRYQPEIVDLGYVDDDGKPVTSLVLQLVERAPEAPVREPRGPNKIRVWEVVQEMCRGGVEARVSAVIEKTAERMAAPPEDQRDRRKEIANRALTSLCDEGFVYLTAGGQKVALSRASVVPEEEFDDLDYLK